jgi:ribosomal protein S25
MELIMNTLNSTTFRTINTVMMWLFSLTVLMLIVPWQAVSVEFAQRIEDNKIFLYFALIVEISNFISQLVIGSIATFSRKNTAKKLQEKVENAVASLDFAEKALLREYVLQRKSVLNLPVTEPTVRNLIDEGVLKVVNVTDETTHKAMVIISKEARPYITYKAIGLTLGKMSDEQVSQIMSARPEYAREKFMQPNRVFVGSSSVNQLFKGNNKEEQLPQVTGNTPDAAA